MRCSVDGCGHNNKKGKKWKFFRFPRNKEIAAKWTAFCRRKKRINTINAYICEIHFTKEDMILRMSSELGKKSRRQVKLRFGSVPSTYSGVKENTTFEIHSNSEVNATVLQNDENSQNDEQIENTDCNIDSVKHNEVVQQLKRLKSKIIEMQNEHYLSQRENAIQKAELSRINVSLEKMECHRNNIYDKLKEFFTEGQIMKLCRSSNRVKWDETDIINAFHLYGTSTEAYKLLLSLNYPLPAMRTLYTWLPRIKKTIHEQLRKKGMSCIGTKVYSDAEIAYVHEEVLSNELPSDGNEEPDIADAQIDNNNNNNTSN